MPDFVDEIIIVDDFSNDNTSKILFEEKKRYEKVTVLSRTENGGSGAAKRDGYIYARSNTSHDIYVTMDGDGQMAPDEIKTLIEPLVEEKADFTKANRLVHGDVHKAMPKYRFWGNAVLTLMTKIASGYWHVTDAQTGFTACTREVLVTLPFKKLYTEYGYPNHLLVMLNIWNFRVKDIPSKPIYGIGELSHIKVRRVVFRISWMLNKAFWWRMKEKYIIRDFHPLIFFYTGGFSSILLGFLLSIRLFIQWYLNGRIPPINALSVMFFTMIGLQFLLFAMWFDMEANKHLK